MPLSPALLFFIYTRCASNISLSENRGCHPLDLGAKCARNENIKIFFGTLVRVDRAACLVCVVVVVLGAALMG